MSASSPENSVRGEISPDSLDQQAWIPEGSLDPRLQMSNQDPITSELKGKDVNRQIEEREIEEADVLYAGTQRTDTREEVSRELELKGLSVAEVSFEELKNFDSSVFQDKTIFYRDRGFPTDGSLEDIEEASQIIEEIEREGASIVNSVEGSAKANNKDLCKHEMKQALWDLPYADAPQTYKSMREIETYLDDDDIVVKKPLNGLGGKGIEFLEAGEIEAMEEGFTYEQYIPHESSEEDVWDTVSDSRIWVYRKNGRFEIDVVDRENNNEEGPAPTNISQEGEYVKPMDYGLEEQKVASRIADRLDMDVFAIDCIRREAEVDGEEIRQIVPYEANSTAGTQLNETQYTDGNIHEKIAKVVEEEHRGSGYQPGILDRMLQ